MKKSLTPIPMTSFYKNHNGDLDSIIEKDTEIDY